MGVSDFVGARRIPLIGRRTFLQEVGRRMKRGGVHVLYFEGEGGIGKTALLDAALASSRQGKGEAARFKGSVAREIIDLYHVDSHTPEGLMRRISQVIGREHFQETQKTLSALSRARNLGNVELANEKVRMLHSVFLYEFVTLAEDGLVLALDTLEVLDYEYDPFQEELGRDIPLLSAGEWLLQTFLPRLQGNVLLLLAGRPGRVKGRFGDLCRGRPGLEFWETRLGALQEEETQAYLHTIADLEEEQGDRDAAERLREFEEERGQVVHFLTGGRPILLALVADLVACGSTLPRSFGSTLRELRIRGVDAWRPEIERALVVRIQESPSPLGETIRALAWLRKGATPELLARVMALTTPEGDWDGALAQRYLDQVTALTLVKVRPNEHRVFLHDEMYTLLDKHILTVCSQEERDRVYEAILQYYQDQERDLEQQIEACPGIDPILHAIRCQTYVETIHYRLCHWPALGFAAYFWRAEDALNGLDTELDMLLRTEMLRTVGLLRERSALGTLNLREVEMDVATRWGMRVLFFQNDADGALEVFDTIAEKWKGDAAMCGLAWAHLQLYRGAAMMMRAAEGDWPRVRDLLQQVVREADEQLEGAQDHGERRGFLGLVRPTRSGGEPDGIEGLQGRARILKAQALYHQGYLDRQQGRYAEAVEHYQASAMLQRRLRMAGLASVLINLAYVMALMGDFRHARLLAEEAERWARRRGQDHSLALALNVRAIVAGLDGHHTDALHYADQSLEMARGLRAPRVRGLIYSTRARALRYLLASAVAEGKALQPEIADQALKEANHAVNLLRHNLPDRVAALIERGCMYREIARSFALQNRGEQVFKARIASQRDLERTIALAGAMDLPDQAAAAWTNLGWLWYYTGQPDGALHTLKQVYAIIPPDYLFPDPGPLPPLAQPGQKSEARLPFWSVLGKAEMLRAYIALDHALEAEDEESHDERLYVAVNHITLALAYDEQIADEFFDITRAEDGLHKRILRDGLSIWRLHQQARAVAMKRGLAQPTRFQAFLGRMFGPAELWA